MLLVGPISTALSTALGPYPVRLKGLEEREGDHSSQLGINRHSAQSQSLLGQGAVPVQRPQYDPQTAYGRPQPLQYGSPQQQYGSPQQQQQSEPQGLLGQVQDSVGRPLDFNGQPQIRDQQIINPNSRPVDVPGATQLGVNPERVGPSQQTPLDAQRERIQPGQITQGPQVGPVAQFNPNIQQVAPGQTFQPPSDVNGIAASQQGQYGMNANNQAVGPSQTHRFDPNSGRYIQRPDANGFGPQGDSLEQATFQRGVNRIDPYLQEQREGIEQRLSNQGIPVGSEAHSRELDRFERSRGDQLENLALSSVGAGRQEQGRLFNQDLSGRQFGSGEAGRQFSERLGATQFNAGEAGRGFRENLASNQNQFGQNFAANQFNAAESGRRFGELSQSQGQEHSINLGNRQFSQSESARNFGERMAGNQNQYNQQLGAAQFGAGRQDANFAQQLGAAQFGAGQQQQQFNQQLAGQGQNFQQGMQQGQFGLQQGAQQFNQNLQGQGQHFNQGMQQGQFNANQNQQGFQNNLANQQMIQHNDQFMAQQQANQFNQDFARRGQGINEQMMQRQQPLNELGQLFGMAGQVQQPQFQQQVTVRSPECPIRSVSTEPVSRRPEQLQPEAEQYLWSYRWDR